MSDSVLPCSQCGTNNPDISKFCFNCGSPMLDSTPAARTKVSAEKKFVLILIGICGFGGFAGLFSAPKSNPSISPPLSTDPLQRATVAPRTPAQVALGEIRLEFKWSKGGFDNVMMADFTIINPTPHVVKDLKVTCEHSGNSGTRIDSNTRTIYEVVPAKGRKTVREFNMGWIHSQAVSSACSIVDLEVVR